jgi:hypothetical protein
LPEGASDDDASVVFNNSAQKVIKDARYQSITYYYRCELRQPLNTKIVKRLAPDERAILSR